MSDSNSKYQILLISNTESDTPWKHVLQNALLPSGTLHIVTETQLTRTLSRLHYDIIIIDASSVDDVVTLVRRLRTQDSDVHIVVVTASPTWRRARAVLLAGASDYIRRSLNENKVKAQLLTVLRSPVPLPTRFKQEADKNAETHPFTRRQ